MKRNHVLTAILLALLVLAAAACASAAEIRPLPLDHDTLDLGNGVFSLVVRGGDRAEAAGGFTAVLYLEDRYDGEQIRKMAPGDTVWADDRKWTVKEVVIHSLRETPDVPTDYEIYTEEDLGAEEYLAITPCEDGTFRPLPVWKFCHGFRDGLDTAVITAYTSDCEAGLIEAEITAEEAEEIRRLAMTGTVSGKGSDEMVTGGTWVYSFTTPGGTHLLSIELYRGMIVGADGMYNYR